MNKKCTFCKVEKSTSQFGKKHRKTRKGNIKEYINIYCMKCATLKVKLWRKSNPEKVKEQNSSSKAKKYKENWLSNNKDKRQEYEKQYYLNNIDKFKERSQSIQFKNTKRAYKKNRRHNDLIFRLRGNISNAILKALKRGKSNKAGQSILQYLNYTIQDLKIHIEKQFDSQMSWINYGIYWHIDHIIPQSCLPYSSMKDNNFNKCWALENLRPLEAKQNMLDGLRRIRHKLLKTTDINIYQ